MKMFVFVCLILLVALGSSACATDGGKAVVASTSPSTALSPAVSTSLIEQALIQIEKDGTTAMVKDDVSFIEKTFSPDWVWTMANGMVLDRAQLLSDVKAGYYKFTAAAADDLKVHVHGDSAIVTGKISIKGKYKGQDISGIERFTDTFVNQNGQWHCVATHNSPAMK